jgi:site-specific DNA-adenine methylase
MNKGLILVLRAIGVNITDADAKMIETIIPQIPTKIQELWGVIKSNLENVDARLRALEQTQKELIQKIEDINNGRT